jgi:hypothetical protein
MVVPDQIGHVLFRAELTGLFLFGGDIILRVDVVILDFAIAAQLLKVYLLGLLVLFGKHTSKYLIKWESGELIFVTTVAFLSNTGSSESLHSTLKDVHVALH